MFDTEPKFKQRKSVIRMDPDCAICHAPATLNCDCEAQRLDVAIRQAEQRMMQSIYNDIRSWVRAHAQDYILEYFRLLTERRKKEHSQHMERIAQQASYYYNAQPHPQEIAAAQASLKRGIDEDWQASVQRYPEVLEYFYSLVELTLPDDNDPMVKDPPLSAMNGARKMGRRGSGGNHTPSMAPAPIEAAPSLARGRTPPPPQAQMPPMPPHMTRMPQMPPIPPPMPPHMPQMLEPMPRDMMRQSRRTPVPTGAHSERRSYRPPAPPVAYYPPY